MRYPRVVSRISYDELSNRMKHRLKEYEEHPEYISTEAGKQFFVYFKKTTPIAYAEWLERIYQNGTI